MKRFFYLAARRILYALRVWREYFRPVGPFFFRQLRPIDLDVSPIRETDVALLERFLPSKHTGKHRDRLEAQNRGVVEYLVARYGIPVGYVLVVWDPKNAVRVEELAALPEGTGYMEDLYIHPAARGKGIGRLLWEAGERQLEEKGYRAVLTTVMHSNPEMENTHLRKGYRPLDSRFYDYRTEYTDENGRKRTWSTRVKYFTRDL
jgi:ribosomal protein S18 acetylase RimI-like enzyme